MAKSEGNHSLYRHDRCEAGMYLEKFAEFGNECSLPDHLCLDFTAKEKADKTFAFTYMKIMKEDGSIVEDGTQELYVYKVHDSLVQVAQHALVKQPQKLYL